MSRRRIHICQSVEGALKNWDKKTWNDIGKENGVSGAVVKKQFELYRFEGKKVIPIGDPCEGFSYIDGCPGHQIPD